MWNLGGTRKMLLALSREGTKGIFDAVYRPFYLTCYQFPIKITYIVIHPLDKIQFELYSKCKVMFCISLNFTQEEEERAEQRYSDQMCKLCQFFFLHFLGNCLHAFPLLTRFPTLIFYDSIFTPIFLSHLCITGNFPLKQVREQFS